MSTKEEIYKYLKNNKDKYLSGTFLAGELGVSRNAVWKAIKTLENEGVKIEGISKKGYRLIKETERFTPDEIARHIENAADFDIKVFETIDSTNTYLKEIAGKGAKEGTLVVAGKQHTGRGRMNRPFVSPKGSGVYFSLLLRPNLPAEKSLYITTIAAVSVAIAVMKITGKSVSIKWVNDILINDKKICGILTEGAVSMESGVLEYAVLGIGINIKEPEGGWPEELKNVAGSIFDEGEEIPIDIRTALVGETVNEFMKFYKELPNTDFISIYKDLSCLLEKEVYVIGSEHGNIGSTDDIIRQMGDKLKIVKVIDIADNLGLVVEDENGNREVLQSGEVSVRVK